jgi:hypothetical protein
MYVGLYLSQPKFEHICLSWNTFICSSLVPTHKLICPSVATHLTVLEHICLSKRCNSYICPEVVLKDRYICPEVVLKDRYIELQPLAITPLPSLYQRERASLSAHVREGGRGGKRVGGEEGGLERERERERKGASLSAHVREGGRGEEGGGRERKDGEGERE